MRRVERAVGERLHVCLSFGRIRVAFVIEVATLDWADWYNDHRRLPGSSGSIPPTEAEEACH